MAILTLPVQLGPGTRFTLTFQQPGMGMIQSITPNQAWSGSFKIPTPPWTRLLGFSYISTHFLWQIAEQKKDSLALTVQRRLAGLIRQTRDLVGDVAGEHPLVD